MNGKRLLLAALALCASACAHRESGKKEAAMSSSAQSTPLDLSATLGPLEQELVALHGAAAAERIHRGLTQAAGFWRAADGDAAAFSAFAKEQFLADQQQLDAAFARYEALFEQLDGHFNEIGRELRRASDLEIGPLLPVDPLFGGLDAAAHLTDDLFRSKVAFAVLLNFPLTTLQERLADGKGYSRRKWAEVRLAGRFARRVPPEVQQRSAQEAAKADLYISQYNLWMHHLLDEKGERLFPSGLRLISHWNLRDELKADYSDPKGLAKQRMIVQVMSRIVSQTIPAAVIDNPRLDWNPFSNAVTVAPADEVEANAPARPATPDAAAEPDVRYARWLAQFQAARGADPFSPVAPTAIARSFESRELPEERVVKLFTQVLTSPLVPKIAALIEQRLGRKLEPADLWFNGFQARGKLKEPELDAITQRRYPKPEAFAQDLPRILTQLGFAPARAKYLASKIVVDPSRGAGHAMQAMRRGDFPHLRTRVEPTGMNYKGYNIAVHELGHNVEQVFSLYDVDHTLLTGVPNNAFTEALAFLFQARDLELLGQAKPDAESERQRVLSDFWQTWEIAGVALVDLAVWHWMYEHPNAAPAELREAVLRISKEHWNRFYAPVLGGNDTLLLGIYSHSISYPLYLPDYPLGHLIAFQIEEHLRGKGALGPEFERMAKFGAVSPDLWMENATGSPVSAEPLLKATERALEAPAKR